MFRLRDHSLLKQSHHVKARLLTLPKFVLAEKRINARVLETCLRSVKPEKLHNLLPHLVKLVLNVFRKLSAKTLHPWEVFLAPAAELEDDQDELNWANFAIKSDLRDTRAIVELLVVSFENESNICFESRKSCKLGR